MKGHTSEEKGRMKDKGRLWSSFIVNKIVCTPKCRGFMELDEYKGTCYRVFYEVQLSLLVCHR